MKTNQVNTFIDVIIPTYNSAPYLNQCIKSLCQQSFTKWRALLIDDCSNDGTTPSMCDKWSIYDKRIEVIHLPTNYGIGKLRNYALTLTTAPFIAFLDSDDFLAPNHLQSLYDALTTNRADAAMCGHFFVPQNGNTSVAKQVYCPPKGTIISHPSLLVAAITDKLITSFLWARLYKREVLSGINFEQLLHYEDYAVHPIIMAKVKKLAHTGEASYYYRIVPNSLSRKKTPQHYLDFAIATEIRHRFLIEQHMIDSQLQSALKTWIDKNLFLLWHKTLKLPQTEERDICLQHLKDILTREKVTPYRYFRKIRLVLYSLKKRRYEHMFYKKLHPPIKQHLF